ncbi:MAG: toprim domain-containing protein [Candidatus Aenigmarchaeota archaeon]|nr:toprim domain-containing protein [Candidatus Aenigmarchaeota archaeon]NIP39939.1 toprim domain-containing protein [Candidatus Aenigmarchaeota archaeon]NIQ17658.1 toprim domain-containing protein [Candidatus Aenigmarchaeota archaeon]NIS72846.1 toprim domain-containing protein [Candidatus Aenigmarchaeota archaeon]
MTRNKKITIEELNELLKELKDKLLIVEGKNDKKALKSLGLKNIIAIDGRPLYEVVENINTTKEIVILTDFDKKGREIEKRLRYLLQKYKKRTNSRLRGKTMSLGKNQIEDLANLDSQIAFKEVDVHVKVSANVDKVSDKSADKRKRSNRET